MNGRPFTTQRLPPPPAAKSGVALLLVLGLIAILSLLMLTFSRVTRTERLSSWHEVNSLRAEELARLALTRAMADVQGRTEGRPYGWEWDSTNNEGLTDLGFCSQGDTNATITLSTFNKTNELPSILIPAFDTALANAGWISITINSNVWPDASCPLSSSSTVGRISYIVLNASGCADLNWIGGTSRSNSTSPHELDPCGLDSNEITNATIFLARRAHDATYETQAEATNLNMAITSCDALVPYSYDPDRDVYFTTTNTAQLGTRDFATNLAPRFYVNDLAATNWSTRITNILAECGMTSNADEMACRLADYLDADRIPTNSQFISEAVPLLNEVGLMEDIYTNASMQLATQYVFEVELWYPFDPAPSTNESFSLTLETVTPAASANFAIHIADCSFTNFPCFTWTNTALTSLIPPVVFKVSVSNASVFTNLVYTNSLSFSRACTNAWNDPRIPTNYVETPTSSFGSTNSNCTALTPDSHGLPIHHRDGAMLNIGELGYIHTGEPWRNIDLGNVTNASLLDRLTVRNTSRSMNGLISTGSTATQTLNRLLYGIPVGYTRVGSAGDVDTLIRAFTAYDSTDGRGLTLGTLSADFLRSLTNGSLLGVDLSTNFISTDLREDLVRGFVELVSFRHSLYYVIVSAQVLAADGQRPVAERTAIALVWRDTYTGQYFIRWFRWLE